MPFLFFTRSHANRKSHPSYGAPLGVSIRRNGNTQDTFYAIPCAIKDPMSIFYLEGIKKAGRMLRPAGKHQHRGHLPIKEERK